MTLESSHLGVRIGIQNHPLRESWYKPLQHGFKATAAFAKEAQWQTSKKNPQCPRKQGGGQARYYAELCEQTLPCAH